MKSASLDMLPLTGCINANESNLMDYLNYYGFGNTAIFRGAENVRSCILYLYPSFETWIKN